MHLRIFDVEHRACALLSTSNGRRIMIDCGHNGATGWRPGDYLRSNGITSLDRLIITNYDEDHVSGLANLLAYADVQIITRNASVSPSDIRRLKREGGIGAGIETLIRALETQFTASVSLAQLDFGDTEIQAFHNTPYDFDDENDLSLVVFVTCAGRRIVFPGDLEVAGWLKLLENSSFRTYLASTDIFVASHHGRENGFCEDVFQLCRPEFVIISDKYKLFQSQETVPWYRAETRGFVYNGGKRHVVTTRRDGEITLDINAGGTTIWLENGGL